MRRVEDKSEVEVLLRKYEFEFVESVSSLKGNIEPLTTEDIDDVLYDMRRGVKIFEDDGKVVVEYPSNICRLESRNEIKSEPQG